MKYALIALFAIACSDSEEAAPTEAPVAEEKAEKKPNAPKDAGHDGAHGDAHGGDHSHKDAGVHIGPVPEGAKVFFVSPKDGETVTSPVKIQMAGLP